MSSEKVSDNTPNELLKILSTHVSFIDCPHQLYPIKSQFAHHLLWILRQESLSNASHKSHVRLMSPMIRSHSFCWNCVNVILSIDNFANILGSCVSARSANNSEYYKNLESRLKPAVIFKLISHPKAHKMMNSPLVWDRKYATNCCSHLQEFNLCLAVWWYVVKLCELTFKQLNLYRLVLEVYPTVRLLYLSMKNWNSKQIICFYKNELNLFHQLIELYNLTPTHDKNEERVCVGSSIHDLIGGLLNKLSKKLLCKDINYIFGKTQKKIMITFANMSTDSFQQFINNRTPVKCYWWNCKRYSTTFKLCKGCQMAYYCSRKCQKASWNNQHRFICNKLKQNYDHLFE
eukprot:484845_1